MNLSLNKERKQKPKNNSYKSITQTLAVIIIFLNYFHKFSKTDCLFSLTPICRTYATQPYAMRAQSVWINQFYVRVSLEKTT